MRGSSHTHRDSGCGSACRAPEAILEDPLPAWPQLSTLRHRAQEWGRQAGSRLFRGPREQEDASHPRSVWPFLPVTPASATSLVVDRADIESAPPP